MRTFSRSQAGAQLAAYDFGRHEVVADIGGGTGAGLASILAPYPSMRGILFDQPHVVAGAGPVLSDAGVAERVTVVGGSFFESVPSGADAYVMRRILHDWPDAECVQILVAIRRSLAPDARLLIIDAVVGAPNEDRESKFLDLMMLVSAGGRERTEPEWRALLTEGGFTFVAATRATVNSHVIEAVPA